MEFERDIEHLLLKTSQLRELTINFEDNSLEFRPSIIIIITPDKINSLENIAQYAGNTVNFSTVVMRLL